MELRPKEYLPIVAVFILIFIIAFSSPLSILSSSIVNDRLLVQISSSESDESVDTLVKGTMIDGKIMASNLRLEIKYDSPVITTTFTNNPGKRISCWSTNPFDIFNQVKQTSLLVYEYRGSPIEVSQKARFRIYSDNVLIFDDTIELTKNYVSLTKGISVEPQFTAFQGLIPSLSFEGYSVIYDTSTKRSYILTSSQIEAMERAAGSQLFGAILGKTDIGMYYCPSGGVSMFYDRLVNYLNENYYTTSSLSQSIINYNSRTFDENGKLSFKANKYVKNIFTVFLPETVDGRIIWRVPKIIPKLEVPSNVKVSINTPVNIRVCNMGEVSGSINLVATGDGLTINNGYATVDVPKGGCVSYTFYVTQTQKNVYSTKIKVTASNRENIDTQYIGVQTTENPIVDECALNPNLCYVQPSSLPGSAQTTSAQNITGASTGGQDVCIPFFQRQKTVYVTPILSWFNLGQAETRCEWNYANIAIILIAGALILLFVDTKQKYRNVAFVMLGVGAAIYALNTISENTLLMLGIVGILLVFGVLALLVIMYGKK